jgi:hypothetical protein
MAKGRESESDTDMSKSKITLEDVVKGMKDAKFKGCYLIPDKIYQSFFPQSFSKKKSKIKVKVLLY